MQFTLADLLSSELLKTIILLTEMTDFSSIPIKSVSVQEQPFDNFIGDKELVLTTAIGYKDNNNFFTELISYAYNSGASVIFMSFPDDNPDIISLDTIELANRLCLPIFLVPWHIRFADISSLIFSKLQKNNIQDYSDRQAMLFNLFFRNADLKHAVEYIDSSLSVPIEIQDADFKPISKSSTFLSLSADSSSAFSSKLVYLPIMLNNIICGYFVYYPTSTCNQSCHDLIKKYIILPISLWFYQKTLENISVTKVKHDFVWNLAHGEFSSMEDMYKQSFYLKFNLKKPYVCINMLVRSEHDRSNSFPSEYSLESLSKQSNALNAILYESDKRKLDVMVASNGYEFIIFLETPPSNQEKIILDFVSSISPVIQKYYPKLGLYWGISEIERDIPNFHTLYTNASIALKYSFSTTELPHIYLYKSTKKNIIISSLSENAQIQKQAAEVFNKLIDYDSNSNIGLLDTLTEYINCNYNLSETARRLHIHRQSLIYRLSKIEDLTNMSLQSHDDLFILEVFSRLFKTY